MNKQSRLLMSFPSPKYCPIDITIFKWRSAKTICVSVNFELFMAISLSLISRNSTGNLYFIVVWFLGRKLQALSIIQRKPREILGYVQVDILLTFNLLIRNLVQLDKQYVTHKSILRDFTWEQPSRNWSMVMVSVYQLSNLKTLIYKYKFLLFFF